jgi:hypothetical protein
MTERDLVALAQRAADVLLKIPGVHAVGVGVKESGGQRTDELSIRVFVTDKRPLDQIPPDERVPAEIDGVKTDVVQQDIPTIGQLPGALSNRDDAGSYRPLRGGIQITAVDMQGSGTLGCLARVTGDPNTIVAITCHHVVLERCGTPFSAREVGQPLGDGGCSGCCSDIVGTLLDAVCDTDVDVAIIKLSSGAKWLAEVLGVGVLSGNHDITQAELNPPQPPYQVRKRGRTTQLTGGYVTDIGLSGSVNNPDGTLHRNYTNAIRVMGNPDPAHPGATTNFSSPGDSGAAIVNAAGEVVAILFGGGAGVTFAQPIGAVIAKFATGVPAARQRALMIATAAAPEAVQVVPIVGLEPAREPVLPQADRERLDVDLRRAPLLNWYFELLVRHRTEVTHLINTNRRVAMVWHRSGAAELAQTMFRAFRHPNVTVPSAVRGRPLAAVLADALAALDRYGSPALRADAHTAAATIPDVNDLTYRELVDLIAGRPAPSTSTS